MTQKDRQAIINSEALSMYNSALEELLDSPVVVKRRLRSCSAFVIETKNYYILQSYNTKICVMDKNNNRVADVLRIVFGYTATSAQHVAKFVHDYSSYIWDCNRLTARPIDQKVVGE